MHGAIMDMRKEPRASVGLERGKLARLGWGRIKRAMTVRVGAMGSRSNPRNLLTRWWGQPDVAFGRRIEARKWACPDYPRGQSSK
jgi:hypothetical protein